MNDDRRGNRRRPAGPELEIALALPDPQARRTRRDLYEQMRNAIRAGRLMAGLRMPASPIWRDVWASREIPSPRSMNAWSARVCW